MRIDSHYTNTFTERAIEPASQSVQAPDFRYLSILQHSESSPTCLESIVSYLKKFITWIIIDCICCKKKNVEEARPQEATPEEIRARLLRDSGNAGIHPRGNLRELPSRVQENLISFLTIGESLQLTEICKSLYGASRRSLQLRENIHLFEEPMALRQRTLELINPRRLLSLDVSRCDRIALANFPRQLGHLHNLQVVNISQTSLGGGLFFYLMYERVQKLNVSGCHNITAEDFADHLGLFTNLQELNASVTSLDGRGLARLSVTLQKLDVSCCRNIAVMDFVATLRRLVNLQELGAVNTLFNGACLASCPTTIRKLDVAFCRNITRLDFTNHLRRFENLQELHVQRTMMHAGGLAYAPKTIQKLNISGCSIPAITLEACLPQFLNLKVLFADSTLLNGAGLASLRETIQFLDISHCSHITAEDFAAHLGHLVNLQTLLVFGRETHFNGAGLAAVPVSVRTLDISSSHITADDLTTHLGRLVNLRHLVANNLGHIPAAFWATLRRTYPNLTIYT